MEERLNQPISVLHREQEWFIINKPYDCRIQNYPGQKDMSGI
jgi:tRNA pseudouridine32 synthase/23S rRNA pseudouridine746 synthase